MVTVLRTPLMTTHDPPSGALIEPHRTLTDPGTFPDPM